MDAIFKALSDDTRRALLDMLRERDGQTLSELEEKLGMTRFGVMKHLKVLEAASLVVSRKSGRFKHHYLNAVPLQEVIDRWIEPLVQKPLARMALEIKAELEGTKPMDTATLTKPDFMLETHIRTTVDDLWTALTDPEASGKYHIAHARVRSDWKKGSPHQRVKPDGDVLLDGEIIDIQPKKRLEFTFIPHWEDAKPSRCVYEIEAKGDSVKLTVLHFGITKETEGVKSGWMWIMNSLKSYLETGEPLDMSAA